MQYSVFECRLRAGELARLQRELARWVDAGQDSVRFYRLCQSDVERIRVLGQGTVTRIDPFRIV